MESGVFASAVVAWQAVHGRNSLPWQNTQDPYRVWLSEIMLQQTQVVTVKDYFARFLARFPTVQTLAEASLDEVLGLWSGLGYYSRARNLHRCAQDVMHLHGGSFPSSAAVLVTLPGIGRSTAAAIASLCFGERVAIMDANVKRVLTRALGFDSDLASARNERTLWDLAETLLPAQAENAQAMPRYTQGMMDLGATVCTPKKPQCLLCPVNRFCMAAKAGNPEVYPVRTRKLKRSTQSLWLLWVHTADMAVALSQRPTPGVWAGLYCLPLFDSEAELLAAVPEHLQRQLHPAPVFTHVLTHKDLHMHPWSLTVAQPDWKPQDSQWMARDTWEAMGLPAPIRKLLSPLAS
ncbi:A/G-specific adenine glycosylase [Rhodoferax aquaticus]|uniref:Adenine DNA glycosylase n=1 Tax=Rhodoferax aquaticus TaxID=2527691 RepID=A0A515EVH4_9BURK|nr:A/G-specific adenine glycosylase [Rhodoferax aquaticus]QDL56671.1 A/G-specific adenine glycosylase [Rhodoferax aquaticus]